MTQKNKLDYMKETILGYLNDYAIKKAILINGEWGSGKTYYIKKFLDETKNNSVYEKYSKTIMLSLFGINSIEEIDKNLRMKKIISEYSNKTKNKLEFLSKNIKNFIEMLDISSSFKFNIDLNNIGNFINYNQSLIIFDDLERCSINIIDLIGFINNLVENEECKVIVIANENEINTNFKPKFEKYKEKIFSMTLNFKNDFKTAFNDIVDKFTIKGEKLNNFLHENEELIRNIFFFNNSTNLRILETSIYYYKKIFEMIDSISIVDIENLEMKKRYLKEETLKYTFDANIKIKNKYEYNKLDVERENYINSGSLVENIYSIYKNDIKCDNRYYFIDKYIISYIIDEVDVREKFINLILDYEDKHRFLRNKPYKLNFFKELEDEELNETLKVLEQNLKNNVRINIDSYSEIIKNLDSLLEAGYPFDIDIFIDLINKNLNSLEKDIKSNKFNKDRIYITEKDSWHNSDLKNLNQKITLLNELIKNGEFLLDNIFGLTIELQKINKEKKFLSLFDKNNLIKKIKTSKNKELTNLKENITLVYQSQYVEKIYENDKQIIDEIINWIENELKNQTIEYVKRINLTDIKKELDDIVIKCRLV